MRSDRQHRFLATQDFALAAVDVVATHFGVPAKSLRSPGRHRQVSRTRAVAVYILKGVTSLSWPEIGALLGGFHHTSMIAAARRVKRAVTEDALFKIDLLQIVERLLLLQRPKELGPPEMRLLSAA